VDVQPRQARWRDYCGSRARKYSLRGVIFKILVLKRLKFKNSQKEVKILKKFLLARVPVALPAHVSLIC
jgi:hypothetical protein